MRLIEFECRGHRIALPLSCVKCAVASALPDPLPGASEIVLGVLNVAGELVVVVDFCRRLGLPAAPIVPSQQMLVIELSGCLAGVLVDRICGVTERAPEPPLSPTLRAAAFVSSVARLQDGLCLVVDPERFLFADEADAIVRALAEAGEHAH